MDGIQSWSSFEQQRRDNHVTSVPSSAAASNAIGRGINALYVSSSSPDIAPAAATHLRHSGLTAPTGSKGPGDIDSFDADSPSQVKDDEEFRLRFHWMRPHPSLAFALKDELAQADMKNLDDVKSEKKENLSSESQANPVVQSAKLMEAYRYSQMTKQLEATNSNKGSGGDDQEQDNDKKTLRENGITETNRNNSPTDFINTNNPNLSLELPKLRINLASLVEPELMSSWLPGEDTGVSYYSDEERDDMDE